MHAIILMLISLQPFDIFVFDAGLCSAACLFEDGSTLAVAVPFTHASSCQLQLWDVSGAPDRTAESSLPEPASSMCFLGSALPVRALAVGLKQRCGTFHSSFDDSAFDMTAVGFETGYWLCQALYHLTITKSDPMRFQTHKGFAEVTVA